MKKYLAGFILCYFSFTVMFGQQLLIPIEEQGLKGVMDSKGTLVIKPKFRNLGMFANGLAPARIAGHFGYIDNTGTWVIAPTYDMAWSFENEVAVVFKKSKPYLINSKGELLFDHDYTKLIPIPDSPYFKAFGTDSKISIIDKEGDVVNNISWDRVRALGARYLLCSKDNQLALLTKQTGKELFGLGEFEYIRSLQGGLFEVTPMDTDEDWVVNEKGEHLFSLKDKPWDFLYGNTGRFSEGLAVVKLNGNSSDEKGIGIVSLEGKLLLTTTKFTNVLPFTKGVSFAQLKDGTWRLINKHGKYVSDHGYEEISYDKNRNGLPFMNDVALVKANGIWQMIRLDGTRIKEFKNLDMEVYDCYRYSDLICFEGIEKMNNVLVLWSTKTQSYTKLTNVLSVMSLMNGQLLMIDQKEKLSYVNLLGKIIRSVPEKRTTRVNAVLNIDYMRRANAIAASPELPKYSGAGGWASSENMYRPWKGKLVKNQQRLQVFLNADTLNGSKKIDKGLSLQIVNAAKDTLFFDAQDSRIPLVLQAKTTKGEWKAIEYQPSSWCGNSYHTLFLPYLHYWEFRVPRYEGAIKTVVRARLRYKESLGGPVKEVYSNEVPASINPAQFWYKKTYFPTGLMDSYDN